MKKPTINRGWACLGCAGCIGCLASPAAVGHISAIECFY